MTSTEAMHLGRSKVLKLTTLIFILLLIGFLIKQLSSDISLGFLHFLEATGNIYFIAIVLILFGLTYHFGEKAGKDIIIDHKNPILISLKYSFIITLAIMLYVGLIGIIRDKLKTPDNLERLLMTHFVDPLYTTGVLLSIPVLFSWLWATNGLRSGGNKKL